MPTGEERRARGTRRRERLEDDLRERLADKNIFSFRTKNIQNETRVRSFRRLRRRGRPVLDPRLPRVLRWRGSLRARTGCLSRKPRRRNRLCYLLYLPAAVKVRSRRRLGQKRFRLRRRRSRRKTPEDANDPSLILSSARSRDVHRERAERRAHAADDVRSRHPGERHRPEFRRVEFALKRKRLASVGRFHSTPSQSAPLVVPPDLRRAREPRERSWRRGFERARRVDFDFPRGQSGDRRDARRGGHARRAGLDRRRGLRGAETSRSFRERRVLRVRVRGRVDARRGGREGFADRRVGRDERGRRHEAVRLVPSLPRAFRRASRRAFRRARGRGPEVKKRREAGSRHPEVRRRASLVAVDLRLGRAGYA